jgi:hypothetical protein
MSYQQMKDEIIKTITYDGENPEAPFDVANHGADAGWSGFTYQTDCVEFFDRYEETIMEMLQEDAEAMDCPSVVEFVATFNRVEMGDTMDGYKNLLAWYVLETVCRRITESEEEVA